MSDLPTTPAVAVPSPSAPGMMGPKVCLMGPAGTGKTYSLGTLVDWASRNGKKVRVLFTENGEESLRGYWTDRGLPIPDCLAWHSALTTPISLSSLTSMADMVGKLSYEALTKTSDPTRSQNNAFHKILVACANFPDDRTGAKLGAVDKWGDDIIFAIDGLSELGNAAMKMQIGNKPTAAPGDYGVVQNNIMNFLRLCTQGLRCTFVLIAHVSRETDEISGGVKLMVKGPGKALSNEIPQLFSDVIYTVREGSSFYWDTAAANADVKTRNLPIQGKLKPDFGAIMDRWTSRGGR